MKKIRRSGRFKKRTVLITLICVILTLIPVSMLAYYTLRDKDGGEKKAYNLKGEHSQQKQMIGSGINLNNLSSANYLKNSSFEPPCLRMRLVLDGGGSSHAYADPISYHALSPESYSEAEKNSRAVIYRYTQEGMLTLKDTEVSAFTADKPAEFNLLPLTDDYRGKAEISGFSAAQSAAGPAYAASTAGSLINLNSEKQEKVSRFRSDTYILPPVFIADSLLTADGKGNFYYLNAQNEKRKTLSIVAGAPVNSLASLEAGFASSQDIGIDVNNKMRYLIAAAGQDRFLLLEAVIDNSGDAQFNLRHVYIYEKALPGFDAYKAFEDRDESEKAIWQKKSDEPVLPVIQSLEHRGFVLALNRDLFFISPAGRFFKLPVPPPAGEAYWQKITKSGASSLVLIDSRRQALQVDFAEDFMQSESKPGFADEGKEARFQGKVENAVESENDEEAAAAKTEFHIARQISLQKIESADGIRAISRKDQDNFIYINGKGKIIYSHNGSNEEITVNPPAEFKDILYFSDEHIYAAGVGGKIYESRVLPRFDFKDELAEGRYEPGDILSLETRKIFKPVYYDTEEKLKGDPIAGQWYCDALTSAEQSKFAAAPGSGEAGLLLKYAGEREHEAKASEEVEAEFKAPIPLSLYDIYTGEAAKDPERLAINPYLNKSEVKISLLQAIDKSAFEFDGDLKALRFDFKAKTVGAAKIPFKISLSGQQTSVGGREKSISYDWQKYSYLLIISREAFNLSSHNPVLRLEFDLSADADALLLLDEFMLYDAGAAADRPREYIDLQYMAPEIVKLSQSEIGKEGCPPEYWADSTVLDIQYADKSFQAYPLEPALRALRQAGSNPWLVINENTSERELRNLMQFLFAAPPLPYGKMRAEQGTPARYSDIFDKIYLEFKPAENSDSAEFSDFAVKIIKSCPEYSTAAKRLVFIDASRRESLIYGGETDFKSAEYRSQSDKRVLSSIQYELESFLNALPGDPLTADSPQNIFLSGLSFGKKSTSAADLLCFQAEAVLADAPLLLYDYRAASENYKDTLRAVFAINKLTGTSLGSRLEAERAGIEEGEEGIVAYKYGDKGAVLLLNLSDRSASARLRNLNEGRKLMLAFDRNGHLLFRKTFNKEQHKVNLLPKGFSFLIDAEEDSDADILAEHFN